MKVLGLLGAHKPDGITASMLSTVMSGVPASAEKEIINLNDYTIRPDDGSDNPVLDELTAKLLESDVWIFAVPTYWGSMSGVMKNFFDCMRPRLVRFNHNGDALPDRFKNKHYVSLTACYMGTFSNLMNGITDSTFRTIDKIMTAAGVIKITEHVATNTYRQPTLTANKQAQLTKCGASLITKASRKDFLLKRYIELLGMVAIMALITMGLQQLLNQFITVDNFWWNYASFVIIFYILLAGILHFFTVVKHRRK